MPNFETMPLDELQQIVNTTNELLQTKKTQYKAIVEQRKTICSHFKTEAYYQSDYIDNLMRDFLDSSEQMKVLSSSIEHLDQLIFEHKAILYARLKLRKTINSYTARKVE